MARRGLGWSCLKVAANPGSLMPHSSLPLRAEVDWVQVRATLGLLDLEGIQSFLFRDNLPGQDTGLQPLIKKPAPPWERHSLDSSAVVLSQSLLEWGEKASRHQDKRYAGSQHEPALELCSLPCLLGSVLSFPQDAGGSK